MDAESSADKATRSKRRSRSRSTLSRMSTEDSSNADSNSSSVEKEVMSKDSELHNGAVGETEDVTKENAVGTDAEVSDVSMKVEERRVDKASRVSDKWKLHLDLSDSCSLSENDASDVDGTSAPAATEAAEENQSEEPEAKSGQDDAAAAESIPDDCSVSSGTTGFHGFENPACDQEYIDALIEAIEKCETTEDDCCWSPSVEAHSSSSALSPKTESENELARSYSHDDDSNSSSVFGQHGLMSPTSQLTGKLKIKLKYAGSPVPSTSRGSSKKFSVDLSNPAFRKPLDMGWRREIVFRNANDTSGRRLADVYYITPTGRKVRSNREVLENLEGTDLKLENFTFFKEPLGVNDPDKEIIRDAKRISVTVKESGSPPGASPPSAKRVQKSKASAGELSPSSDQSYISGTSVIKQEPHTAAEEEDGLSESSSSGSIGQEHAPGPPESPSAVADEKVPPAVAGPSGVSKATDRSQPNVTLSRAFPRIKVASPRSGRGGRSQSSPRGASANRGVSGAAGTSAGNMEIGMLPPMWKDKDGASTTKVLSSPGAAPSLPTTPTRGPGKVARGGKAGGLPMAAVSTKVCTVTAGATASAPATVSAGDTLLGPAPKKYGVCTIQCPGLLGTVPSLQCRLCLCLYHTECVGLGSVNSTIRNYICKNCQLEKDKKPVPAVNIVVSDPPPLTPIRSLEGPKISLSPSVTAPTVRVTHSADTIRVSTTPPKLQRFPRQDVKPVQTGTPVSSAPAQTFCSSVSTSTTGTMTSVTTPSASSTSTKLVMVPTYVKLDHADQSTQTLTSAVTTVSIVGSVTTWLPPSSQISVSGPGGYLRPPLPAMSPAAATLTGCPPPPPPVSQGLVRAGGRRYIVLPKHNVLSVSPAGATLSARPLGLDAVVTLPVPGGTAPVCDMRAKLPPTSQPTYLIGAQNPPGVLLVPVLGSPGIGGPGTAASLPVSQDKQQFLLVNGTPGGTPGGFVLSATAATGMDAAAESRKRKAAASPPEEAAGASKRPRIADATNGDAGPLRTFMSRYMPNICETYNVMLRIFEYLRVQELLRASRVCRLWRSIATHQSLWQTVRLKNSPVADWKGCVTTLAHHGTRHLDMRKMLVPAGRAEDWWAAFCANIGRVQSLESVELCRCPAAVVERVAQQCPQLTTLSALSIKDQSINLSSIGQLKNLQELRIRNLSGMYLNGNLDGLKELTNLKHLSLTMVKNLGHAGCGVLGSLQSLETLELGECCDLPPSFGNQTLSQLHALQRLRLEKGQGDGCPTFSLLAGVRTLPSLVTLELVNFDVKPGFDAALARCTNIRRLLIIPTYISQVDILPLTKLQKMLATALPNTKIKILKVDFQATWRQYISETDF